MVGCILTKYRLFRKKGNGMNHGGLASLDSLNIKLHALACIATHAVSDHPKDVDLFHTVSSIADLLRAASVQSDQLDPEQIVADMAAIAARRKPAK